MLYLIKRHALGLSALATTLALGACGGNACDDVEPASTNLRFFLLTPSWQNLLGNGPGQIRADSLQVQFLGRRAEFTVVPVSVAGPQAGPLVDLPAPRYVDGCTDARLWVRLSRTDTDTLDVSYSLREGQCARAIEYHSVFYNGRRMGVDGNGFYQLVKY